MLTKSGSGKVRWFEITTYVHFCMYADKIRDLVELLAANFNAFNVHFS